MKSIQNRFSLPMQFLQHFLFGILLASLFYVFVKHSPTAITVTFYANQAGVMSIISSGTMVDAEYQTGQSTKTFTIAKSGAKRPFRLDPFAGIRGSEDDTFMEQNITIDSISIAYLGDEISVSGRDLLKHIVNVHEVDLFETGSSLAVKSKSEDPQIFIRNLRPSRSAGYLAILYCIGLVLLFCILRVDRNQPSAKDVKSRIFIIFILPLCGGIYLSQSYIQLLLVSVLIVTLLSTLVGTLYDLTKSSGIISSLQLYSPISVFLLLIFTPVLVTLSSSNFLDGLKRSSVYDKKDQGNTISQKSIKQFITNFEKFYSQSYLLRTELLHINAGIKLGVFGHSPTKKAIIGKEGMYFEGHGIRQIEEDEVGNIDTISDYLGLMPFTDQELDQWRVVLEERYYWLKEHGISYVFVMAPDKSQIYPEFYPDKINSIMIPKDSRRYDQLITYLKDNTIVPVVDLRKVLLEIKEQAAAGIVPNHRLFYRTDGHWNAYGAFWAYRAIIKAINTSYPRYAIPVVYINDFVIHEKHDMVHRQFMNLIGLNSEADFHDTFLTLYPKPHSVHAAQVEFVKHGINIDKRWRLVTKVNNDGQIPFLFLAGDSFAQQLAGYFSIHVKRIGNRRFVNHFDPDLIKTLHPDLYIQEMLNMYLLYKVPENPEEVKLARKRALENS